MPTLLFPPPMRSINSGTFGLWKSPNADENEVREWLKSVADEDAAGGGKAEGDPPSGRSPSGRVEAQGIEPWSETGSRTASTCVGRSSCRHALLATDQPSGRLSLEDLTDTVREPVPASPDLRLDADAPDGLQTAKVREASVSSAYAASASSELAFESFQVVYPGTWTWARCRTFI